MVACALDPRFKKLRFTTDLIKRQIYKELFDIFSEEKETIEAVSFNIFFINIK